MVDPAVDLVVYEGACCCLQLPTYPSWSAKLVLSAGLGSLTEPDMCSCCVVSLLLECLVAWRGNLNVIERHKYDPEHTTILPWEDLQQ